MYHAAVFAKVAILPEKKKCNVIFDHKVNICGLAGLAGWVFAILGWSLSVFEKND